MITVENLTKRYGGFTAVDDISFEVRPGSVVGFLGPNGAGKPTAMRMMTGLTPPTSGREVLRVAAISIGVSRTRVEEALALVGLDDEEAGRRVRNYSLGMRQRLGIAAALLGEPQVLVLDEPANGLDPQGIHWMRGLLRRFADGGGTVLLSSHLLHEVQIVADDLVMIGRGKIVAMGSKEELLSRGGTSVSSTDDARLAQLLQAADVPVTRTGSGLVVEAEPRVVGEIAAREAIVLLELRSGGSEGQNGHLGPDGVSRSGGVAGRAGRRS